jgi:ribosomal subunit interface protein
MKIPLELTFQGFDSSEAIRADVEKRVDKLERFFKDITSCRVVLEAAHKSQHHTRHYQVHIDITVPGKEIVASSDPAPDENKHDDLYIAIRDAFDAAERQLKDFSEKLRENRRKESRTEPPRAVVAKIFEEEGYGFLEATDGREIYFHKNALLNNELGDISVGAHVEFAEEEGDKGPQATSVRIVTSA